MRDPKIAAMLSEMRACLCLNLRMAARAVSTSYDEALRPLGLRVTQFSLLGGVALLGPVTFQRLAEALALDKTTLPRSLAPLARQGLVSIEIGEDRRSRLVLLTPAGEKMLAGAYKNWRGVQDRFEAKLRGEGFPKALRQLRKISIAARA